MMEIGMEMWLEWLNVFELIKCWKFWIESLLGRLGWKVWMCMEFVNCLDGYGKCLKLNRNGRVIERRIEWMLSE